MLKGLELFRKQMIQKTLGTKCLLPEVSRSGALRFPPEKGCSSIRRVMTSGCLGENASFETVPDTGEESDQICCMTAG